MPPFRVMTTQGLDWWMGFFVYMRATFPRHGSGEGGSGEGEQGRTTSKARSPSERVQGVPWQGWFMHSLARRVYECRNTTCVLSNMIVERDNDHARMNDLQ